MHRATAPKKTISNPIPIKLLGNRLTLTSPAAFPPGSLVQFELNVSTYPEPMKLLGKIISIVPGDSDCFRIVVRLHNLTREQSADIHRHFS